MPTTKVTVLSDGTYATQTVYSEETAIAPSAEEDLPLRKCVVEGDSFLASVTVRARGAIAHAGRDQRGAMDLAPSYGPHTATLTHLTPPDLSILYSW